MFYAVSEKQRERERGVCDTTHLVPVSHMYIVHPAYFPLPLFFAPGGISPIVLCIVWRGGAPM